MKRSLLLASLLIAAAVAGCASARPPEELVDARAAYARANVGPAAHANTSGLEDARRVLDEAERKFAEDPESDAARHLAYLAHRRILLAETNARATIATTQRAHAEQALAQTKDKSRLGDDRSRDKDEQKARSAPAP